MCNDPQFENEGQNNRVPVRIAATVLFNPVINTSKGDGFGYRLCQDYWQAFSPHHNLSKDTPPTLLMIGDQDTVSPKPVAEAFEAEMKKKKASIKVIFYEGQGHRFFNTEPCYSKTLIATDEFLAGLGFIRGSHQVVEGKGRQRKK